MLEAAAIAEPEGSTLYTDLFEAYGPTMDLGEISAVMKRNRNGVRCALRQVEKAITAEDDTSDLDLQWARELVACKMQVGKKILFRTRCIANLMDDGIN